MPHPQQEMGSPEGTHVAPEARLQFPAHVMAERLCHKIAEASAVPRCLTDSPTESTTITFSNKVSLAELLGASESLSKEYRLFNNKMVSEDPL